ncbi:hypothetical protein P175DRAFT_0533857 [Aspergillus ochraceoroseus IBT 24754]|uniref:Uncharacterized protein n=1 Tax=Aspergillus ochraceoroseus IBT 24754 TaxID=1392256 RepID=A0A2T5LT15_9EURO|nr:uncharacterized protein P175DRAFT_0533857 [Aspergillus ochraceoroseus IBT 24754]PTU19420.1 hypothetical protein P175DRAFT_0533857 [Aspergillus ochraceoroseus IBT 24754]
MKFSFSVALLPIFVAIGVAVPVPTANVPRQLQGADLPSALSGMGGVTGLLSGVNLPLVGRSQ